MCFHYSNKVTGIYELSLCKIADTGSPGKVFTKNICIKLFKSDKKDIYNVTKDFYFK